MVHQQKDQQRESSNNELLRSVETGLTVVSVRKDNVIEIRFKKDEYEVDVKDQMEIQNAIFKLTKGGTQRHHIMVIPGLYGGITKEAREKEMFSDPVFKHHLSVCIIARNLPVRILGKFFYKFKKDKPLYPFMFFGTEEQCLDWIKKQ